MKYLEEW